MTIAGLTEIGTPELIRLLAAVETNTILVPLRNAELRGEGFAPDALLAVLGDLDRVAVTRLLQAAVAERRLRPPPHLDLVWTGPEARGATTRDTAVLVAELLAKAKRSVLIAGFSFDHGRDIFAPLHAAMQARQVVTEIFLDIEAASGSTTSPTHVRDCADKFLGRNWPFGPPFPTLYYDPRTATPGIYASLHAKCLVVDAKWSLITSANFTNRGQTRNIELGVLIEDGDFATRVLAQWGSLVEAGLLEQVAR